MLLAPDFKEPPIAEGDVVGGVDGQARGGAVNPIGWAFKLGVVADGGLVDHAVAFARGPLGAPFLITKRRDQAQRTKDLGQGIAVGDLGFGLDAVLVRILAGANVRKALVGQEVAAGVIADAENLSPGSHPAVRGVIQNIAFEAAWGFERESGSLKAEGQAGEVVDAEFDLGFDGHGKQ